MTRVATLTVPAALLPPSIGAWWPGQGGVYAGVLRTRPRDVHIVCGPRAAGPSSWAVQLAWAYALRAGGHADWTLPSRAEAALLACNDLLPGIDWFWTREPNGGLYAWVARASPHGEQDFFSIDSMRCAALAVRSVPVSFTGPSAAD